MKWTTFECLPQYDIDIFAYIHLIGTSSRFDDLEIIIFVRLLCDALHTTFDKI